MAGSKCIGIDIGTYSVKCARLDVYSKGFSVSAYNEYPLDQDPNRDRHIQLIEILRIIASGQDPHSTHYVLGLNQDNVSVRFKSFPFRERPKILKSVPFELEDDIPLDQDDAIFDAKVVRNMNDQSDVLAVAAPKAQIKEILDLAHECGIEPDIVSVEGFAFANSIEDWLAAPPAFSHNPASTEYATVAEANFTRTATLHLHIGHSHTLVGVFQNNSIVAMRSILWGGKNVADAITRKFQIPYFEALKVLQTKSFILPSTEGATRDQIVFSQTICESVDDLIRELKLTLLETKTELNVEFQQALLSGGVAQIPHLSPYITQGIEIPTNLYNHLSRYSQTYIEEQAGAAYTSNVALGLAFEGLKKPRNPAINLRREEFGKQSQTWQNLWNKWNYTAKIAGAALALVFIYAPLRDSLTGRLTDLADTNLREQAKLIAHLTGSRASESGIRRFVTDKEKEIKARDTMNAIKGINSALDVVKKFNDLVPRAEQVQVDIRHLSVQKETMVIQGEVANSAQLELLKKSILPLAVDGKIIAENPISAASPAHVGFNFRLRVARWMKGVPK